MKGFISELKVVLHRIFKFDNYFYNVDVSGVLENNILIIFTFLRAILVVPILFFIIAVFGVFIINIIVLIAGESEIINNIAGMLWLMTTFLIVYEIPIVALIWNLFRIKLDKDSLLKNIFSHMYCFIYIVICIAGISGDIKYGGDIFHSYWAIPIVATLVIPILRYIFIKRKYKDYDHYKEKLEKKNNNDLKFSKKLGDIIYNNILLGVAFSSVPFSISELILLILSNFLGEKFIQNEEFYYILINIIGIIIMSLIIRYLRDVKTKAGRIKSIILPSIIICSSTFSTLLDILLFSEAGFDIGLSIYVLGYICLILVVIKKLNYFRKSIA